MSPMKRNMLLLLVLLKGHFCRTCYEQSFFFPLMFELSISYTLIIDVTDRGQRCVPGGL